MLSVLFTVLFTLTLSWAQVEVFNLKYESLTSRSSEVFTQGLYFHQGQLFESSGKYAQSFIQKGSLLQGKGLKKQATLPIPAKYFAEGSCYCQGKHWVLTWKSGVVFQYDEKLSQLTPAFKMKGEGWGLSCYQNKLILSNGSSSLFMLDPQSGRLLKQYEVQTNAVAFQSLNELEVIGDYVLINRWYENEILVFDLAKAELVEIWKAHELAKAFKREEAKSMDSMNGIAWNKQSKEIWVTGKYWPGYFKVKVPSESVIWQFVKP